MASQADRYFVKRSIFVMAGISMMALPFLLWAFLFFFVIHDIGWMLSIGLVLLFTSIPLVKPASKLLEKIGKAMGLD